MSRTGRTWIRIAVTGILFLLFLSGYASAAGSRQLTASCPSRCAVRIAAREGKGGLILSLPGFWDLSKTALEMEGTGTFLLGEAAHEVPAGQETDLTGFTGQRIILRNESRKELGYLTILQGSEIPALFLEVDAEALGKVNRSKDNVITEGRAVWTEADGTPAYDGALEQLKGRGNNTFSYSKKPYQLKFAEKAALSGMGRGKTWVLLANWNDMSLLRNRIVLDMSREIGLKYSVSCVPADVWINGIYNGLYLMTEKIQIGRDRIDITNLEKATEKVNAAPLEPGKMTTEKSSVHPLLRSYPAIRDPEDITGGYIFTVEKKARMKNYVLAGFRTKDELSIRIKEPTCPSTAQAEYLFDRVSEAQRALMAKDGIDPQTGKSYDECLDTGSFARKLLIEDWSKNYDFFGGSQYMYKDSDLADPLIYAGPSWDYDLSFGNMVDRGYPAGGAYVTAYRRNLNLYWLLYGHEPFRTAVREVWKSSFRPALAVLLGEREAREDGVIRSIDEYREQISDSAKMNRKRWPAGGSATGRGSGGDFEQAVKYLKRWVTERTSWMDGEYGAQETETKKQD